MRTIVIAIVASVAAFLTCMMCEAPKQDYPIHYALWYLIISHENPETKGTQ